MEERAPVLRMEGVVKRFGPTVALSGVDLEIHRGEVHALIGENGAGKSTLMKVLAGALPPDEGTMALDGQPYRPRNPGEGRRSGIAMIYQELSLAPHLTVMENVLLGREPGFGPLVSWRAMREHAGKALEVLGVMDLPPEGRVRDLSPSKQQLVEIARAVALGSRILVLDEPTSSLGASEIELLFELLDRLRGDGHAIVYISHFLEEVQRISDRYTVLRDGRSVGSGDTAGVTASSLISLMVGREVTELYPRSRRTAGETLLEAQRVTGKRFPVDVSFSLRRGEILGIAGLIGSGRTELLRVLFGLDPLNSGEVRIRGTVGIATPSRRWREGVGMVSEDRAREGLARELSIADNMTLPRLRPLLELGVLTRRAQDRAVAPWIERTRLKCESPRQPVQALSGGNQQKVALARLLHAKADVLLLDEPTRGIDVGSKAQIYELLDRLATGDPDRSIPPRAVLMVSSYLPELLGVCDRIAVMHRGRIGKVHRVADVDEHRILVEATGGGEAAS